ncbi:MAG TPA: 2-hydroxyacid dehydrogenase [Solirubrobacterales bacterium]|nr:2-hydroxyacid dehydrogenase [Solirubrobacterales bacterium]
MLIWASDRPERGSLVLPDGAVLETVPRHPAEHPGLEQVEVLVPPYRSGRVLEALPKMPRLRLVQALESGVEWLLPHVPAGIPVCNARGAHDAAVAEWVVGAILAMQRKLPDHLDAQRESRWRDVVAGGEWQPPYAGDLEGATVLILGHGSIGAAVERRLQPFGVELLRVASRERAGVQAAAALPELVPRADVVVLLVPLTPATEGMIDAELLSAMRPGTLLVNAGRGALVDQPALTAALYDGRLRAALDVTDPEPLPADDPLWSAPNLLLTPHIAGDTPRRFRRSWELVGEQVSRLRDGRPLLNVVRPA